MPMYRTLSVLFPLFVGLLISEVRATQCNVTTPCPASAPCCSEFGFCGDEHFCLGGCNPYASNTLTSCKPAPICKSATYTFPDNSRILTNATLFDGNATAHDWVVDKGTIINTNTAGGELALLLTETNNGTRISSTRYIHYGKITFRLKTGKWKGVVTAAITMSDVKDEIDWEYPGNKTHEAQSNLFWRGVIPEKTDGLTHDNISDTFSIYNDFAIDWTPDSLTWLINDQPVRTVKSSDFVKGGITKYPSTPSRVQLSIWPGGSSIYPPGTIEWAGGMIDWKDPDYAAAGHFYILVKSVQIECKDPVPPNANVTGYIYTSNSSMDSVAYTNASTLLNGGIHTQGVALHFSGALALTATLLATLAML